MGLGFVTDAAPPVQVQGLSVTLVLSRNQEEPGMHCQAPHHPRGAQCVLEFPLACGITVGTPVRIRGVPVGSVLAVHPSLERVEVLAEVRCGAPTACHYMPLKTWGPYTCCEVVQGPVTTHIISALAGSVHALRVSVVEDTKSG